MMTIDNIVCDLMVVMASSCSTEIWEPEPCGQRDSGGTKRMLDAYYEGLNMPALASPEMRAELIEIVGLELVT